MGDSGSPPVFASPRVKEKVVNLASNLGAKYVWKTTTANNMRGVAKGILGNFCWAFGLSEPRKFVKPGGRGGWVGSFGWRRVGLLRKLGAGQSCSDNLSPSYYWPTCQSGCFIIKVVTRYPAIEKAKNLFFVRVNIYMVINARRSTWWQ